MTVDCRVAFWAPRNDGVNNNRKTMSTRSITVPNIESDVKDYFALMKPRVMSLVVFTGIVGMILSPVSINPIIAIVATFCIALGSGAAASINMWYDRDMDAIMSRTKNRPIVTRKVPAEEALAFGIIMSFFSVFIMCVCVNFLSGFLLLFTILFYVVIYTIWLKRRSTQNIVIGGLSGALPPLIGWTSATGSISVEPLILVMLIFLWTPAHFWALALYRSADYEKANVPMMPVIFGQDYTKLHIVIYTLLTVACSFLPYAARMSGKLYLASAVILGGIFIYYAFSLLKDKENQFAPRMFFFSMIYLFSLFFVIALDH
jgi:protoheme IX farnesyltransferase